MKGQLGGKNKDGRRLLQSQLYFRRGWWPWKLGRCITCVTLPSCCSAGADMSWVHAPRSYSRRTSGNFRQVLMRVDDFVVVGQKYRCMVVMVRSQGRLVMTRPASTASTRRSPMRTHKRSNASTVRSRRWTVYIAPAPSELFPIIPGSCRI